MLFASTASADWSFSTTVYQSTSTDPEAIVQQGYGLQATLLHKIGYLYISKDVLPVRFGGQGGPDINLWSAGLGMQHKIGKHFTVSADIGWYEPKFDEMGKPQGLYSGSFAEGLMRYLNKFLMPENQGVHPYIPNWEYYTYALSGSLGGKFTLGLEYPITENILFNMTTGYRYLKLREHITGQDYDGGYARLGEAGHWTIKKDRDFSGWIIGGGIVILF